MQKIYQNWKFAWEKNVLGKEAKAISNNEKDYELGIA